MNMNLTKRRSERALCGANWKKSKQRRISALKRHASERGWSRYLHDLDELRRIVATLPSDAVERIYSIHRHYLKHRPPGGGATWTRGYPMRMLTLHLLESYRKLSTSHNSRWRPNNATERAIGLWLKICSTIMRGFQRTANILPFVHLSAYLCENRVDCQLARLC